MSAITRTQFRRRIFDALYDTLDSGPGPRAVALITADVLTEFILNEAGGNAAAAVGEIVERMQNDLELVAAAEREAVGHG